VTIDLASLHVSRAHEDGIEHDLIAFDPQHELRPDPLDAMFSGRENIEYVSTQADRAGVRRHRRHRRHATARREVGVQMSLAKPEPKGE